MDAYVTTYKALKKHCKTYLQPEDITRIEAAYQYAKKAHQGQKRRSKAPYITHLVEVALILGHLQQDTSSIMAGLLHDTLEDTDVTEDQLTETFGEEVCYLVQGVTKLGKLKFQSKKDQQAENFRKMFLAMAKDIRVIIIKLSDRLHNMRTLSFLPIHKRHRIARETRDIFSPLAHRMGMWSVKWELEDLIFSHLEPAEFDRVKTLVASSRKNRESYVSEFIHQIQDLLSELNEDIQIYGRPKHLYSIYQKLTKHRIAYDELYDHLGIRIIVPHIKTCYAVLGLVHSQFKPIYGRFKDYIAMPKSNMYQSLHTTVIGPKGNPVEIQIRTLDMHDISEQGIASHWRYKEDDSQKKNLDKTYHWLQQLIAMQQEQTTASDYMRELKVDLFIDEVFVFTPKGEVHVFPKGATPVDFAYKIHTEIGHRCIGAKINGKIVSLNSTLTSGDRLEILTSKTSRPNADWLHFVKTHQAKSKIRQFFKRQHTSEAIENGEIQLVKALKVAGFTLADFTQKDVLDAMLKKAGITKKDELFKLIAQGEFSVQEVVRFLNRHSDTEETQESAKIAPFIPKKLRPSHHEGVLVLGEENIAINFAKCCNPVPGDSIIGFITRGRGVSIHHIGCSHIIHLSSKDKKRLIDVQWVDSEINKVYPVSLVVEAFDRMGVFQQIIDTITNNQINIREVKTKLLESEGRMQAFLKLEIPNMSYYKKLQQAFNQLSDVVSVTRIKRG